MIFHDLLQSGSTIFISGGSEELRRETLDPLLASDIQHFYFIKPKKNLRAYLEEIAEPRLFSYVRNIKNIDIGPHNVIACGFRPVSRGAIAAFKNHAPKGIIFFERKLGLFKSNWLNLAPGLTIEERSLSTYVAEHSQRKLYKSSKVVDTEGAFFTNRGEMLNLYRDFMERRSQRCCKIIGMKGIGKRAFIRRLKFVMALGDDCFEVRFTDHTDDISYLLAQLLRKFSVTYTPQELEHFSHKRVLPVVERLFQEFDRLPQAKIIFYDVDAIYDIQKRQFYDRDIAAFFHQLIQRESYRRYYNRLYFVANHNFGFRSPEDRDATYTIELKPLHPEHIRFIVEYEFNSRFKHTSAQAFMRYNFDTVHKLLGGHPQIAKLFVEACDTYPMESIVKDAHFRKKFDTEKAAYLMQHIRLSDDEEQMLNYLALFTAHFTIDAIKAFRSRPHTIIENLRDKFLLEKEDFADGHSDYYVPSIIQDYARIKMDEDAALALHNRIGMYYWSTAEDLNTPPPEALEAYRLALYHFSEAHNTRQEKHLAMYFKGIFLKKAQAAYKAEEYGHAWQYYHEVYQRAELDAKDLLHYIRCHARLDKPDVAALYDQALRLYPQDRFLKTAYARHLLEQGRCEQAEALCNEILRDFPHDKTVHVLRTKIQHQRGDPAMTATVFISYSHHDSEFAQQLKRALEAQQIGVTIDVDSARFGEKLDDFAKNSVRASDLTISVVSRNSLQSVWALAETLESFMHEVVQGTRKFLPIYIDTSFLDDECYLEIVEQIDADIAKLKELTIRALDRNLPTTQYDDKRQRLITLRNNLDAVLTRLRTYLVGDFSTPETFQQNLPKLVEAINAHVGGRSTSHTPMETSRQQRLQDEYDALNETYQTQSEGIQRLRRDLAIETDTLTKFKLEKQLEAAEAERQKLAQQLDTLEAALAQK